MSQKKFKKMTSVSQKTVEEVLDVSQTMSSQYILDYEGEKQLKSDCCSINGLYYKIGDAKIKNSGAVYTIGGVKYRITTGKIIWNNITNSYTLLKDVSNSLFEDFIIMMDDETLEVFNVSLLIEEDVYPIPLSHNGTMIYAKSNFNNRKYCYDYLNGVYDKTDAVINNGFTNKRNLPRRPTYVSLPTEVYSMSDYPIQNLEKFFRNNFNRIYKSNKRDHLFEGYSYGFETETDLGKLPETGFYFTGCVPLKDGSIKGSEITSMVIKNRLTDYIGKSFAMFNKFTGVTSNNSLHLNISGFRNDVETRIALFYLYSRIEAEIESVVPWYKRNLAYLSQKAGGPKDHCKPLPIRLLNVKPFFNNPDQNYDAWLDNFDAEIFKFLNNNIAENNDYNRKNRRHVAKDQPKWEHHGRYYTLNLEALYFGPISASRAEFRVHSGTVNPLKAIMWTHMCTAIVRYAENNTKNILTKRDKITLQDVIEQYCGNDTELLTMMLLYIETRIKENSEAFIKRDETSQAEFTNDNIFDIKMILQNKRVSMTEKIFE